MPNILDLHRKIFNVQGSFQNNQVENFREAVVVSSHGDTLIGEWASKPKDNCHHAKPFVEDGKIRGLRLNSHSAHTLSDILSEFLASEPTKERTENINWLSHMITSEVLTDDWLRRAHQYVNVVFFGGKLGGLLKSVRFIAPATDVIKGKLVKDNEERYSGNTRADRDLLGAINPESHIVLSSYPEIKDNVLRRSRVMCTFIHECLHAFDHAYRCNGRRCQKAKEVVGGMGVTGHGPEWAKMARAVEAQIAKIDGFHANGKSMKVHPCTDLEQAFVSRLESTGHLKRGDRPRRESRTRDVFVPGKWPDESRDRTKRRDSRLPPTGNDKKESNDKKDRSRR